MEDRGQNEEEEEEEEDNSLAERNEEQAGVSVEAQIGRKLRQIGDKFNQDHVDLVSFSSETPSIDLEITQALSIKEISL